MDLTNLGLYSLQQAAALSGAKTLEINRWLFGYRSREGGVHAPLWEVELSGERKKNIGFRDLMELRIVSAFVRKGVPLRVIRQALVNSKQIFGIQYPLTSRRFLTDGQSIYHEALDSESDELTDLVKRQLVFRNIIKPSLYEGIEFDKSGAANRWFPMKDHTVVVDPTVAFGRPSLASYGVPTETLFLVYKAEGNDFLAVSHQFGIPVNDIQKAVKFESQLLAA
ncbi:DUF433 domain-containing protein [Limnobacter humi]|uniref:DUF433 domain-containing protein n=1 Tax=Limnobacter humi TaxID=1778671 RepID=A0ABT1WJJ0_9BURK|nr:DUF433 domain-containing protein [Limnobacter humi]MCQ8897672.1 DUF433 domain-containing protein [Limnobacter humi]